MDSIWLTIYLALLGVAIVQTLLMTLQAHENRRFARSRLSKPAELRPRSPRVALFVPCKGMDLELEDNLRPLFEQDYPDYAIRFVVEAADDPACGVIDRLIGEYVQSDRDVTAALVVAGLADDCGQKIHNLRAAVRRVDDGVGVFAFVDSDARPGRDWLSTLVARLGADSPAATTGYRWFIPQNPTFANYLMAGINGAVAGLFGPGGHHLVWGGSWAVSREVFDSIDLDRKWKRTLSDDLVASRALHAAKKSVGFEPACLVGSPLDQSFSQVMEFIRRQYIISRFYVPRWWLFALCAATFTNLALWGGVALAAVTLSAGDPRWQVPFVGGFVLYLVNMLKTALRHDIGRMCLPQHADVLVRTARFDIIAWPVAGLVNWIGLVRSAFGNTITWRGIRYRLGRGGIVQHVERVAPVSLAFAANTTDVSGANSPSSRARAAS
jgi:hypothetical protein